MMKTLEDETGVGRRKFLSAGGGVLAGAGTLGLAWPGPSRASGAPATRAAPGVAGGPAPIYPDDSRYATMRTGFNQRWVGSPAAAQRSSIMRLQYRTYWASPADDQVNLDYCDVDLPSSWPTLYYQGGYRELQAVKARWDPRNVFHHAQAVVGAGA